MPRKPLMPRLNTTIMIQKDRSVINIHTDLRLGGSPGNSPPCMKQPNNAPISKALSPISANTARQETHSSRASETNGAATKPKFGASSWMAIAFPQFLGLMKEVSVAIPEGRYIPAAMPKTNSPKRIPHRSFVKETPSSVTPTVAEDKMMVLLCVSREDMNPEHKIAAK